MILRFEDQSSYFIQHIDKAKEYWREYLSLKRGKK